MIVLAGALLLGSLALAAPSSKPHRCPSLDSVGTLQVLHYNNLGPQNNGSSAVLVHDRLSYAEATARCATIGEKLHPWFSKPSLNQHHLGYELDYLAFAHEFPEGQQLWVSHPGSGKECYALSCSHKGLVRVSCNTKLPALCTSSPPPTKDIARTVMESTKITVASHDYTVTGYRDARSFRFLGIPFANPPLGELRFAPPQAYSGPKNIDATKLGASCIQSNSSYGTLDNGPISEDCLFLNVYTPVLPTQRGERTDGRPVAVYFYGGSFLEGTSSMVDYDGGNFASRSDVVIVTLNYRVGALGFLATGKLTTGSYGIRDQIMALKWVQEHIAAFGGDPSRVTIFGQSAGGQSVVALLSSSAAKGLFSGALVQSAPLDLPWFPRAFYSQYIAPTVGEAVGCDSDSSEAELLKCLRAVPADMYLDNSTTFGDAESTIASDLASHYYHNTKLLSSQEPFMPMLDDCNYGVVDDQFYRLLTEGKLPNHVPTMFTTVHDEAGLYVDSELPELGDTQAALDTVFEIAYGADLGSKMSLSGAFQANWSDPDGVRNAAAVAVTYSEWECAQGWLLNHAGDAFPSLYEVEINQGHIQTNVDVPAICSPNSAYNATCHSSDVLLAWGTLNSKTLNVAPYYDDLDIRHSQLLHDVWGAWFRTHNPNPNLEFLKVRGPAYATTYTIFAGGEKDDGHGYEIQPYSASNRNLTFLGMPPSHATVNFADTDKCAVFQDYGFTFQRAKMT
ncbi:CAZyme family CE10 [Penicillium riverlandense]|uniref:CAZyme family CE10 n=1 Tax=Penicillium riverlandense TaxID=1903569 RepID=UPI002547438D|nr:CAZyme family CE10 [Penicillium riverlandense]KAJ5806784.1 CAZyme family CE10 [Penicillium riverlandense]